MIINYIISILAFLCQALSSRTNKNGYLTHKAPREMLTAPDCFQKACWFKLYYYLMLKENLPRPAFGRLVCMWDPFQPDLFLR